MFYRQVAPRHPPAQREEALRAIQITLLFAVAMLWLGAQAAQTDPHGPVAEETPPRAIEVVESG